MRRNFLIPMACAFFSFASAALCVAEEKILNLGDPAPTLAVSSFVKGDKVEKFEPGKTYVVEFWATWCGPCKQSIPHLTELAHKYKDQDVQMIGVDVWEHDVKLVEPFLKEMGDKMDYTVALDTVPEGKGEMEGLMATTWMKAAEEHGIPTAFVIRDGKIAWIGHPMAMDEPLAKIMSGDWGIESMAKERLAKKEVEKKMRTIRLALAKLQQAKDYPGLVKAIDEATAADETLVKELEPLKFAALCKGADIEKGLELGDRLKTVNWNNAPLLNRDAWNLIDPNSTPKELDPRVAKLALEMATRAAEISEDPQLQDTLAEAKFRTGDFDGAVACEEKVIKYLQEHIKEDTPAAKQFLKRYSDRLEKFREAAAKKTAA